MSNAPRTAAPTPVVRRTSHLDACTQPDGGLAIEAAASDVFASGASVSARLTAMLDAQRTLRMLDTTPAVDGVDGLLGERVGRGFRARADLVLGARRAEAVGMLVGDLPIGSLLSGYAVIRQRLAEGDHPGAVVGPAVLGAMTNVCAGWRAGGSNVVSIAAGNGVALAVAPAAEPVSPGEGWHPAPGLAAGGIRRVKRVEVTPSGEEYVVDALLRDTYGEGEGHEVTMHEYTVAVWLDQRLRVLEIGAVPRVLPFPECYPAARHLAALQGLGLEEVAGAIRQRLAGPLGCTHLADLLSTFEHLPALVKGSTAA